MIHIYKADSDQVTKETKLNDLLCQLPEFMHKRAKRYRFEKDAFDFALGRMLLKKGLFDLGIEPKLDELDFYEGGKPFIKNVSFNISHTQNLVVCSFTDKGEIGIDVEKIKPVKLVDFEAFFTKSEWDAINKDESSLSNFYWYWTRKESILKALGLTLSQLHQIEIDARANIFIGNKRKWYLTDLEIGSDYQGAICTSSQVDKINMIDWTDAWL